MRVDYSINACPHRGDTADMYMGVVGPGMAYYVDENFNLSTTPVPYVDNLQNLQDLSGGFTFTIPHLVPEGNYVIRAVITDPDDRFNEYSNVGISPTFFVDVVAPTVTLYMNSSQYSPGSWVDVNHPI